MSVILCERCQSRWEASRLACCPSCLAARWLATPQLIREKHDPRALASPLDTYRSVITPRLVDDLAAVLSFAATEGRWLFDADYEMLVHVTVKPLGRMPGIGIPPYRREADHALDTLFVAEADSLENAHIFAVDQARHEVQVKAGAFSPLGECGRSLCGNLVFPGQPECAAHTQIDVHAWGA